VTAKLWEMGVHAAIWRRVRLLDDLSVAVQPARWHSAEGKELWCW
jgi:hypothetical protein